MTTHEESTAAGLVGDALQRAFGDEPPLTLNIDSIAQRGAHRLRRRRAAAIGGAMLAVATLTAGVAIGVPSSLGPSARPAAAQCGYPAAPPS